MQSGESLDYLLYHYITANFLAISSSPRARWTIIRTVLKRVVKKIDVANTNSRTISSCMGRNSFMNIMKSPGNLFTACTAKQEESDNLT